MVCFQAVTKLIGYDLGGHPIEIPVRIGPEIPDRNRGEERSRNLVTFWQKLYPDQSHTIRKIERVA